MKPVANTLKEQIALIDVNKPVQVYRNLQRKMWSVKQGVVRFHTEYILLKECEFVVKEYGRQRVLEEKKKNVHGFVKGKLFDEYSPSIREVFAFNHVELIEEFFKRVYYDPYTCEHFMCENSPIFKSNGVVLIKRENSMEVYSIR